MANIEFNTPYQNEFLKIDLVRVNSLEVRDRIALLENESDPSSVWTFFISSFLYHVGKVSGQYFTESHTEEEMGREFKLLFSFLIDNTNLFPDLYKHEVKFQYNSKSRVLVFYASELNKLKALNRDIGSNIYVYYKTLQSFLPRLKAIDFYLEKRFYNPYNHINFPEYVKGKIEEGFLNVETLDYCLTSLFLKVDQWAYWELLTFKTADKSEIQKDINKVFNLAEYKSPMIFIEYPAQLAKYKQMLKNWLLKEIEKRKRQFNLQEDTLPQSFRFIVDFANKLMEPADRDYLTKNTPEYITYPEHIFGSFRAYKLFDWFAKHLHNGQQFTFLYRYMRGEEKDFKIKVDPAPFEDWFFSEKYKAERFKVNGVLDKVSRPERVNTYKLVKEMILELYTSD